MYGRNFNWDNLTENGFKIQKHPPIVKAASQGKLAYMKKLLKTKENKGAVMLKQHINKARIWEESEDKMGGYSKEWYWYDDTPLIAAVRNNQFKIARYLLETGLVNPHWISCPYEDVTQTALKAAEKSGHQKMIAMIKIAETYWPGSPGGRGSYSASADYNGKDKRIYTAEMTGDLEEMKAKIELAIEGIAEPTGRPGQAGYNYERPAAVGINRDYMN
jgi:hypothetical protein